MPVSIAAARQQIGDCLGRGDADAALGLIALIRERFPKDYRLHLLSGRALLAKGDVDRARAELEMAAAIAPDDREIQAGLVSCGVEDAKLPATELPPLPPVNGEHQPISAAALGHLYLRQFLLTHCTAQLEPVWQTRQDRPDVGVALAEAHWRLQEAESAEVICRALLESHPNCLKANLILAQMLRVSGHGDAAAELTTTAQELDPENEVAEELYEWLIVRDPALAPLRRREVLIELPEMVATEQVEAPATTVSAEPVEAVDEEVEEVVAASEAQPDEQASAGSEEPAIAEPEQPAAAAAPPIEAVLAEVPVQAPVEEPAPFWENRESALDAAGDAMGEGSSEPAAEVLLPEPEPDIAETAPEPALAVVETEAEQLESPALEWLEVDHRGHIGPRAPVNLALEESQAGCVTSWIASCGAVSGRLKLGALRASSIDSERGALQVLHHEHRVVVALAPAGANLGLVRARLRQLLDSSKEHVSD